MQQAEVGVDTLSGLIFQWDSGKEAQRRVEPKQMSSKLSGSLLPID